MNPTTSNRAIVWTLLLAALAFASFVRIRLREFPLERDEGEYAYAGQLILRGIPPYRLAYNMKLPGTYLAYAAIMGVFGESPSGIHTGLLLVNLLTIVLVYFLGRELFDAIAGGVSAVAYSAMSASPTVYGTAAHATHFVTLFGVAGAWQLWRTLRNDSMRSSIAAGFLLGAAFVMKQQGLFLVAFGAVAVVGHFGRKRSALGRLLAHLCVFAAGTAVPFLAVCIWLSSAGVFDKFWFWTFDYARQYVVKLSLEQGAAMLGYRIGAMFQVNWPYWLAAALGAAHLVLRDGERDRRRFVLAFFVASFLCVCPGLYFREHYFIVVLPAVSLLTGACGRVLLPPPRPVADCAEKVRELGVAKGPKRRHAQQGKRPIPSERRALTALGKRQAAGALLLVAGLAAALWPQRGFLFQWTPTRACREVYGLNPFVEAAPLAEFLESRSAPDDCIAVVGSEPELYFLSKRTSATGYIYMYPLMDPQPFARSMQEEMAREVEAARPALVVLVNVGASWLAKPGSDGFVFEWSQRFVAREYETIGLVDIISPEHTRYVWGDEAAGAKPRSTSHVWIFQRKPPSGSASSAATNSVDGARRPS
jgi:hypothetical protein